MSITAMSMVQLVYSQLSASLTGAVYDDSAWNLSMNGQVNHHPSPKFISAIFARLLSLLSAICAASLHPC